MGRNMWHCRTPGFCRTPQITACSLGSLLCSPTVTPRLFCQFLESTCLDIESKGWCWGPLCGYSKVAPAQQHLLWFSTVDLLGLHWKTLGREQQGWAAWQCSLHTSQGGTKPQFFSQGSSGRRAAVGRGVSTTQSPALGMEQMLCKSSSVGHLCSVEDSRTGTLSLPRLGYHLQLSILSFTPQREVGGFLSLSKDLSPVSR